MIQNLKVTAVVPTLNEAKGILETLKLIPETVDEIIIVDGDSKDGTRNIAEKFGKDNNRKVVIINEKRRGYGRAFKTGFENATGDIIATGDGDGTYPIELVASVIEFMNNKKLDFVSCSRFPLQDKQSMKGKNLIGNIALTIAASTLWVYRFSDVLSGMWVFRRSCLGELNIQSDSWNLSEEIKIEALTKLKSRFAEFPIPYRERLGETKLIPWKVGIQNLGYMFAMRTGTRKYLKKYFGG